MSKWPGGASASAPEGRGVNSQGRSPWNLSPANRFPALEGREVPSPYQGFKNRCVALVFQGLSPLAIHPPPLRATP